MQEKETEKRPGDIETEQAIRETTDVYKRSWEHKGRELCTYKWLNWWHHEESSSS